MKINISNCSDELELTESSVIIRKRGFANTMASGLNGDRTIAIQTITAVQLKLAGLMPGYILFAYAGSKPFGGGLIEATQDPDAIVFSRADNAQVQSFKTALDERMQSLRMQPPGSVKTSLADELEKLAKLKADGILSEQEFDFAKKRLLR
jgi:hypothetical protein